ncbi:ribosomal protein L2 [Cucumis melo var. makuwa]|uniref:Ribosomal protein L2 (Mitochondrion) n=1 Tax=Cucumis melo var. makuwa TaxID=1194695 RepID=A0A5D3BXG0_CUCMM|nr:ribosomal protein L2 [Cucumis melo var. makuwa]TYK03754.1 ribosomal protein L2 [Cucumis melo var. makuwa]
MTNVNECQLHNLKTIGVDHTRCYHGSKRGQTMTIERFSLSIPSHTGRKVKWQGHMPVWLIAEYSLHLNKNLIGEWGKTREALAEREGLPGYMPMGAGFFEKARAD